MNEEIVCMYHRNVLLHLCRCWPCSHPWTPLGTRRALSLSPADRELPVVSFNHTVTSQLKPWCRQHQNHVEPDSFLLEKKNTLFWIKLLKQQRNARVPERINNTEFLILKTSTSSKIIVLHFIKKEEEKKNPLWIQKECLCSSKKAQGQTTNRKDNGGVGTENVLVRMKGKAQST